MNGALLDDGTVLRLPPPVASQFASLLTPGQTVTAQGWGLNTAYGRVIEVQVIGAATTQFGAAPPAPPPPSGGPMPPRP